MQCDQYREQLELMANANPEKGDFAEARQHLKECTTCQQNFGQLEKVDSVIRQVMNSITPPPSLADHILNRIRITARKPAMKRGLTYILSTRNGDSGKYLDI